MIPYQKILIATDGSGNSAPAVIYGLGLAKAMGAEVVALSVTDDGDYEDMMNAAIPEAESALYQQSQEAVGAIATQGRSKGVRVISLVVSGIPSSVISDSSEDYDLTVIGTAGRTGISHMLLGSVAEKVVRSATSPVLVVHAGDRADPDGPTVKRILIPTEGSENTRPAIQHGLALAKVLAAEVTVMSVADQTMESQTNGMNETTPDHFTLPQEAIQSVLKEGRGMGLTMYPLIVPGTPVNEIVKASVNFDLIVMGTVGRTGLAHIRLGSVAEGTVRQAECPVLVVRSKR